MSFAGTGSVRDYFEEKAAKQFAKVLHDKVEFISVRGWASNLPSHLKDLNGILRAGNQLGVANVTLFSEGELKGLAELLSPLRTLKMEKEARAILLTALREKGVAPTIPAEDAEEDSST